MTAAPLRRQGKSSSRQEKPARARKLRTTWVAIRRYRATDSMRDWELKLRNLHSKKTQTRSSLRKTLRRKARKRSTRFHRKNATILNSTSLRTRRNGSLNLLPRSANLQNESRLPIHGRKLPSRTNHGPGHDGIRCRG